MPELGDLGGNSGLTDDQRSRLAALEKEFNEQQGTLNELRNTLYTIRGDIDTLGSSAAGALAAEAGQRMQDESLLAAETKQAIDIETRARLQDEAAVAANLNKVIESEHVDRAQTEGALLKELEALRQKVAALENARTNPLGVPCRESDASAADQGYLSMPSPDVLKSLRKQIPIYKGDRDALKVDQFVGVREYLVLDRKVGIHAVTFAGSYFRDEADMWFRDHRLQLNSFEDFAELLAREFKATNYENVARQKLDACKQFNRPIGQYIAEFRKLVLQVPSMIETERVYRFLQGLRASVTVQSQIGQPTSLGQAISIATMVDNVYGANQRPSFGRSVGLGNGTKTITDNNGSRGVPMDLGQVQRTKLTENERARCLKEGLCLYCREKGHIVKTCPKKPARRILSQLGIEQESDDEVRNDNNACSNVDDGTVNA